MRFLGYANELGEALRPLIPRYFVTATYGIASLYGLADAGHKGSQSYKVRLHYWLFSLGNFTSNLYNLVITGSSSRGEDATGRRQFCLHNPLASSGTLEPKLSGFVIYAPHLTTSYAAYVYSVLVS